MRRLAASDGATRGAARVGRPRLTATCCLAALVAGGAAAGGDQSAADRAFEAFFLAADPDARARAAGTIMASGLDVKTAYARLARGRTYGPAPAGMTTIRTTASDGLVIENLVEVPEAYDPARRWPVRVQLHGGVSRPPGDSDARPLASNRIRGEDAIYVHPRGHARAEWWHLNQYENMIALLDRLKRTYNVDENRVYLTGVSDGGTGVYFFAMKLPTPFSAFLPLNGNMRVLATPGTRANGQLYAGNAVNRPWFVVNGGRDPLYPVAAVAPHIEMLKAAGATIDFRPQPDAGHDTSWWPSERVAFERFVRDHPRQPHPAAVSWETERTDRYNRVHWLVINELARRPNEDPALADVNRFSAPGGEQRMFARVWPSGRVDARRQGNTFIVHSRGAASFTLLLSPDAIDVAAPVSVWVNGRSAFDGRVTEDLATLVRWAAIDGDRTMLYTVELRVQVP